MWHVQIVSLPSSVWTTDENGWTCIQRVGVIEQARPIYVSVWADEDHWQEQLNTCPDCESFLSAWAEQNFWQIAEHMSRMWVTFECLRTTGTNKMAEHVSRVWVTPVFVQTRTTDKDDWTCPKFVSLSSIWTDYNYSWTCDQNVSCSPVCKQTRTTDKNGWTHVQAVSHSLVLEQIRTTDGNCWMHIQGVSCSPVFEQICW